MGTVPDFLLTMDATVQTYEGVDGANIALYGASTSFKCFAERRNRLVRSSSTGQEVMSSTTVYAKPTAGGGEAGFSAGSLVTVMGKTRAVIECAPRVGGGLPTPDHLEIILE